MTNKGVSTALQEAKALVAALEAVEDRDLLPQEHRAILRQSDKVRSVLENAYSITERVLENLALGGAIFVLQTLGVLEKLPLATEEPVHAEDLALGFGIDVSAITRMMRVLVVCGIAQETEPDTYKHNELSASLRLSTGGAFMFVSVDVMKAWLALPEYFNSHAPLDLHDLRKSPCAWKAGKEGLTYYEAVDENTQFREVFNSALHMIGENWPMLGMFPFTSLVEAVKKQPERVFFVDVAGGKGGAMLAVKTELPDDFKGKFILQDLPVVIDALSPESIPGIEAAPHNIFDPQPVKNAHVYFLRRILHDFYVPDCIKILRNIAPAMGPDSRLIICDMLIPDRVEVGAPAFDAYWMDFAMLAIGGQEKTRSAFREIFEEAGLELVNVYPAAVGKAAMLETRLKRP